MPQAKASYIIGRESQDDRWLYTVETSQGEVLDYATTPEQAQAKIAALLREREATRLAGWKANRNAWAMFRALRDEVCEALAPKIDAENWANRKLASRR